MSNFEFVKSAVRRFIVIAHLEQFLRYAGVGLLVNIFAYGTYLLITSEGMGHKTAMTLVFIVAVTASYLGQKKITFRHRGEYRRTYAKFWVVFGSCYVFNFCVMYVAVDILGFVHQLVQLGLIFFDAPVVFMLQKFLVFQEAHGKPSS